MARASEVGRKSAGGARFSAPPSWDAAIAAIAASQHAVIALSQLRELGLAPRTVQDRAAAGRLHRIHQGVYALVPRLLLAREGHYMAAVLACGPGAVLSHRSAAVLHSLRDWGATKIEVTVPGRTRRDHDGITVHRSTPLTPQDTTVVNNIPCTTVARTLLDLADAEPRRLLERAFDQAEIQQILNLAAINDQLNRNPTRPAAAKIQSILQQHYIGSTPTQTEIEEVMLALCRRIDIPQPELRQWLILPDGGPPIEADFIWRAQKVIVETDSRKWHDTHQRRENDNDRDQRTLVYHWRTIRTTWRQLTRRAHQLEPRLIAVLRA
jgi:predicted transcriptional regulator of viral defense system